MTQNPRPDLLAQFSAPTRRWFEGAFAAPTTAQLEAWDSIQAGHHALLVAPTGSGKTLAAFLAGLDRLASRTSTEVEEQRCVGRTRVLYISPLKALASDVERNLRAPLRGIELASEALGLPRPDITVGIRTGDTPTAERRRLAQHPPDVLITTPESLFLMLSSASHSSLAELDTVIVDEVHALAGTKRGAHLQLCLERLESPGRPFQRVGLSATVSPVERVARFLAGSRPVDVLVPMPDKRWDLRVEVPVEDMTSLGVSPTPGSEGPEEPNNSIWPHLEQRILELVDQHRTTLVFVNSRRVAERLTAHLNELHAARLGLEAGPHAPPAEVMAQSGSSRSADAAEVPLIARAHHGSVSKERRAEIESQLKSGRLPCVVATSSLELGIDMGSIDLVVQVSSPMSIASALQRVGRAGHQVGAVSRGIILPTHRGDLVDAVVVTTHMAAGNIEPVADLKNPLDVLAQHLVSMVLDHSMTSQEAWQLVRRAECFRDIPRSAFEATLDMLAGRYPSEEFAELRPRLIWDRATDMLSARPGARRLVTTSGGTIPDRGLFGVFLVGEPGTPGRRVGELDEEMVHESRVGDVFTLGTTSWQIQEITPHQVLVTPAPGRPGRLPFWKGDAAWRPSALGRAVGEFLADPKLPQGVDDHARENLQQHLAEQRSATGVLPTSSTIVVERFTDELGDWRMVVHCPLGAAVLTPWALAIEARGRELHGDQVRAWAANDGIVVTVPDITGEPPGLELLDLDADRLEEEVTDQVFGSPLFAARFRECAARALLLPRLDPGRRTPLWRQRQRASQLLQVTSRHPEFPIILETMRECLEDVFDLPALESLLRDVAARRVSLVLTETDSPSPFARSLLFGYVGEFLYDGDQPLAERRLAALNVDQSLLAELLGREGSQALIDPEAVAQVLADLQRLSEPTRVTTVESLWDLLRTHGPLSRMECAERSAFPEQTEQWLDELLTTHRIVEVRVAGAAMLSTVDDLGLLRDGLGVPTPPGAPHVPGPGAEAALDRLVLRWLVTHCAVTTDDLVERWGLSPSAVTSTLVRLEADTGLVHSDGAYWHRDVLARVKRRSLALLRAGVEPVEQAQLGRFLLEWQEVGQGTPGVDGLLAAVESLAGYPIPASMLESMVLPARVPGYSPSLLDQVLMSGDVVWTGHGAIGTKDGWVCLWPADVVLAPQVADSVDEAAEEVLERLRAGGAWTMAELEAGADELWQLVWGGHITSDGFHAVRGLLRSPGSGAALRAPRQPRLQRRRLPRIAVPAGAALPGRWSLVPTAGLDVTEATLQRMAMVLQRHGLVTRGTMSSEPEWENFSQAYRVLSAMEDQGSVRRGHAVEGLGASQFALPGAIDRLRAVGHQEQPVLLAACDPANPYGAALPWPATEGHRPSRRAGAMVVLLDGQPVLFAERGVRTLLTFDADDESLTRAMGVLAAAVTSGWTDTIEVDRCDGQEVLGHPRFGPLLEHSGFAMTPRGYRVRSIRSA